MEFSKARKFCMGYWAKIRADRVTDLAAQLAYYFMLSLFPFLIFAITLLGYTHVSVADVLQLVGRVLPQDTLSLVEKSLREVLEQRKGGLLSFGILGTIWAASNALNALIGALNRAYGMEETRSFLKARAVAILLTSLMIFTILVSLILPVLGEAIRRLIVLFIEIPSTFFFVWGFVRWALSFCVMVATLTCIYWLAPNKPLKIKAVAIGALFAALGWQLASLAFSYYLNNFAQYSATYGSLGTMIALMVWLYLTALVIILGGELNSFLLSLKDREDS
jgi:membrane protein